MRKKYCAWTFLTGLALTSAAGIWPESVAPTWEELPDARKLYGTPDPIEIVGGFGNEVNVARKLEFELPEIPEGKLAVLKLNAIFVRPGGSGVRFCLALRLNGRDLRMLTADGKFRLMNRGEYLADAWSRGYKKRMPWFGEFNSPVVLIPLRTEEEKDQALTYVFDISDLAELGKNVLEVVHAGSIGDGRTTLVVTGLEVAAVESSAVRRTRPPQVLSAAEKADFLLERFSTGPEKERLAGIGDAQKRLEAVAEYFRTRSPRPVTLRGNEVHRGDAPKGHDRTIADDAVENRIHSFIPGNPVEAYDGKVDFLTNRTPKRNPDWLAQHNRLGFIRVLGEAWRRSGDEKYAAALTRHLDNWCETAERNYAPGGGAIWNSLSTGVRAKTLCEIIDLVIDWPGLKPESLVTYLYLLQRHGDYLANSGRTPGNWGITEAEGLAFAAIYLPELAESDAWAKTGLSQLREAFDEQVYPDGMHKELNWGYHYYGISWFRDSSELVTLNNRKDLDAYRIAPERFEKMYEILGHCLHPDFRVAAWGDSADEPGAGKMLQALKRFPANNLFRYIGTQRREGTPPENFHFFPDAGFYSVRSGWEADAVHLLAKCGPDGGWHNHFDNGTFELFAYGRNLTPDTGNFTYNHLENRAWYTATARHQTLTLNGENSVCAPKPLLAEYTPQFTGILFENRSYPELTHRRGFAFIAGKYVVVFDEAVGTARGKVAIHFQTAPGAPIGIDSDALRVHTCFPEGANLLVRAFPQPGMRLVKEEGQKANTGNRQPRPAFRFEQDKNKEPSLLFATALIPYHGPAAPAARLERLSRDRFRLTVNGESHTVVYAPEIPALKEIRQ